MAAMTEPTADPPKFKWSDRSATRRAEYDALFDTPALKHVFNDKYIDGLERRRNALGSKANKTWLTQMAITGILAINLLSLRLSISIFGLSTVDARGLRELLLFFASTAQLWNLFTTIE